MLIRKHAFIATLVFSVMCLYGTGRGVAGSKPIGIIIHSTGATVSGLPVPDSMVLYEGDQVKIGESGAAVIRLADGGIMRMSKQTTATFERQGNKVQVQLSEGRVSMIQSARGGPVQVSAGGLSVRSEPGANSSGRVALRQGQLSVTSTHGPMRVEGPGVALKAADGASLTLNKVEPASGDASSPKWTVTNDHAALNSPKGSGDGDDRNKNPIAVGKVGSHVPPTACEHAASPSVPHVACGELGEGE